MKRVCQVTNARAIEPFQKGETPTFVQHIEAGLDALAAKEDALLVFSGCVFLWAFWVGEVEERNFADGNEMKYRGSTKRDRTSLSEAESYVVRRGACCLVFFLFTLGFMSPKMEGWRPRI